MDDPFDDLFNLEDRYYDEGYAQGFADGQKQSRLEAKLFGIEKGFEKFVVMGKLQAKARVWHSQLSSETVSSDQLRLLKHISVFQALVDPATLLNANTDDAVADFDDRLKRAQAKERIIERLLGTVGARGSGSSKDESATHGSSLGDMESFGAK